MSLPLLSKTTRKSDKLKTHLTHKVENDNTTQICDYLEWHLVFTWWPSCSHSLKGVTKVCCDWKQNINCSVIGTIYLTVRILNSLRDRMSDHNVQTCIRFYCPSWFGQTPFGQIAARMWLWWRSDNFSAVMLVLKAFAHANCLKTQTNQWFE